MVPLSLEFKLSLKIKSKELTSCFDGETIGWANAAELLLLLYISSIDILYHAYDFHVCVGGWRPEFYARCTSGVFLCLST